MAFDTGRIRGWNTVSDDGTKEPYVKTIRLINKTVMAKECQARGTPIYKCLRPMYDYFGIRTIQYLHSKDIGD